MGFSEKARIYSLAWEIVAVKCLEIKRLGKIEGQDP
jgi:hypothetical protein